MNEWMCEVDCWVKLIIVLVLLTNEWMNVWSGLLSKTYNFSRFF